MFGYMYNLVLCETPMFGETCTIFVRGICLISCVCVHICIYIYIHIIVSWCFMVQFAYMTYFCWLNECFCNLYHHLNGQNTQQSPCGVHAVAWTLAQQQQQSQRRKRRKMEPGMPKTISAPGIYALHAWTHDWNIPYLTYTHHMFYRIKTCICVYIYMNEWTWFINHVRTHINKYDEQWTRSESFLSHRGTPQIVQN